MVVKDKVYRKLKPLQAKVGFQQKPAWDRIVLNKYMKDCKTILDVGCGVGTFMAASPKRVTGVDHSRKSIAECRKRGLKAEVGKVTELPFKPGSFDGVHCAHVIEHLPPTDAFRMLSEMDRVLKKDGILVIRAPLMHPEFWDDFTHLKVYNPHAVMHYLKVKEQKQRTLDEIPGLYNIVALKYRHLQLFNGIHKRKFVWPLYAVFNVLAKIHIRSPRRSGFMLVLKKVK